MSPKKSVGKIRNGEGTELPWPGGTCPIGALGPKRERQKLPSLIPGSQQLWKENVPEETVNWGD